MIRLARTAQVQVSALASFYDGLDRPEAVRNLKGAVARAAVRIREQTGQFFPAPRPYLGLAHPGWAWLKESGYWIAFTAEAESAVIQAVFHEAADIPGRLRI